jgi:hypothetical protein
MRVPTRLPDTHRIAAIDDQERDHVADSGLERRVDAAARNVDQSRGELREQRLEAQALLSNGGRDRRLAETEAANKSAMRESHS